MPPDQPPLTEDQYWRDFDIIRNDVAAAIICFHTHRTLHRIAACDSEIAQKLNRRPDFWNITSSSLHVNLFIILSRILDSDEKSCSIHRLLGSTIANPEFFSKQALRARKLRSSEPGPPRFDVDPQERAWEPSASDLRKLKKALAPHRAKFRTIYQPIRNRIAHRSSDLRDVDSRYEKARKSGIDEILCFLYNLLRAIEEMAGNGSPPDLSGDNYGYSKRVAEIGADTEELLLSLK